MKTIRKLKADEIECRIAQVFDNSCSLLLYKTARVDRAILEETYGELWQNDFKTIDGKMYGGIAIYNKDLKEWLWRWDCGTESQTEAEKGQASDCFKRAGFKWGIGIELYSAPRIFVNVPTIKDGTKYKIADKKIKFEVKKVEYSNDEITDLIIVDQNGKIVFQMKNFTFTNNKLVEETEKAEIRFKCSVCGKEITANEQDYSMKYFSKGLCRSCQSKAKKLKSA